MVTLREKNVTTQTVIYVLPRCQVKDLNVHTLTPKSVWHFSEMSPCVSVILDEQAYFTNIKKTKTETHASTLTSADWLSSAPALRASYSFPKAGKGFLSACSKEFLKPSGAGWGRRSCRWRGVHGGAVTADCGPPVKTGPEGCHHTAQKNQEALLPWITQQNHRAGLFARHPQT